METGKGAVMMKGGVAMVANAMIAIALAMGAIVRPKKERKKNEKRTIIPI